jgi:hypothetical protein
MDEEIIPVIQIVDSLLSDFSDKIDNQEPIDGDILISQLNKFMKNLPVSEVKQEQINEPEIDENESEGTMIANALGKFMQNLVMNDLIGHKGSGGIMYDDAIGWSGFKVLQCCQGGPLPAFSSHNDFCFRALF